jgi:hypothetical protein
MLSILAPGMSSATAAAASPTGTPLGPGWPLAWDHEDAGGGLLEPVAVVDVGVGEELFAQRALHPRRHGQQ